MGRDGPFQRKRNYLQDDSRVPLFFSTDYVDPDRALRCLEETIGTWDRETRLHFTKVDDWSVVRST